MTVQSILQVKDHDPLGAMRGFLKTLLEKNVVEALFVALEVPSAEQVTPTLVKEPQQLDAANPLAPVMRLNAATLVVHLPTDPGATRVGVVLHPCELRAVLELAQAGRVNRRALTLIGIDCLGTYEPEAYTQIARASLYPQSPTAEMLRWTRQGPIAPYRLRHACQMCEHFVAERADIAIGLIGLNVGTQLLIEAREDLAEKMRLMPGTVERRGKALARLNAIRKHRREQALEDAARWLSNVPALVGFLGQCDACGKCLSVCPFHTTTFQPAATEPSTERAGGALDVLTELGRRATVCVGCGMCESACGHHIPLTAIQGLLGQQVRAEFNYGTGRSVKEVLPWAVT